MAEAVWGADPEFFGPRHAHREGRILDEISKVSPTPGLHLECAAGVGSLSTSLAIRGYTVVAADMSIRSLAWLGRMTRGTALAHHVLPVVADIHHLPFSDEVFSSASSAETLEHLPNHEVAVCELARCLAPGASLVGSVPAGPSQWSDWDDWAGHCRRYTVDEMDRVLRAAGLEPRVRQWGWPLLRIYDDLFLKRINRRRLRHDGEIDDDATLRKIQGLGRRRWLVRVVRWIFSLDRLTDGVPWGVGILYRGTKT